MLIANLLYRAPLQESFHRCFGVDSLLCSHLGILGAWRPWALLETSSGTCDSATPLHVHGRAGQSRHAASCCPATSSTLVDQLLLYVRAEGLLSPPALSSLSLLHPGHLCMLTRFFWRQTRCPHPQSLGLFMSCEDPVYMFVFSSDGLSF